ncbi:MAG TPA: porphobilinogen synthase [Actinomycetota bacterium]|jgi:porphobilinogen synthase|nr:porphobilinogen synthase [Actinomycetota bacterium]
MAAFPHHRARRLRRTVSIRALVRETDLSPRHLVAPMFLKEGIEEPAPIRSMPGQVQHTLESLRKEARQIHAVGVTAFVLFGIPERKDAEGSEAWNDRGVAQEGLRALREEFGDDAVLISDLCLDEYTDHGHCGVLDDRGMVDNDRTLERYRRIAVSQAAAGADLVAPSGMMDGQVAAIRSALDDEGRSETGILAYAAKFASTFYGPFRDAAECAPRFGDRRAYQMDPANADEALLEIRQDVDEGADIVMVKPALPYLDVIRRARVEAGGVPVAAYNVSGEYAMVKAAAERGWLDGPQAMVEVLTSIRRAGADLILTYFAREAAEALA